MLRRASHPLALAVAALALAYGGTLPLHAAVRPPKLQYDTYKLPNGLTVLLSEAH